MPSAISEGIFVGRARELALLEAAAAAACRGQPKVVLIEGEAGIGKSSLLGRFTQELDDARVLRASGDEAECCCPTGWSVNWWLTSRGWRPARRDCWPLI